MSETQVAPYGAWESPVTIEMMTAGTVSFAEIDTDGDEIYWVESRPDEAGRYAAMRRAADGAISEITPPELSARTLVHEYGGGAFVAASGTAWFSHFADQRLYRRGVDATDPAEPISPETAEARALRFADATVDRDRERLVCVVEDHRPDLPEAVNLLAAIPFGGGEPTPIHQHYDFYAAPRLSPDGRRLAWICWNHPSMPWDATELWIADLATDGSVLSSRKIAGDTTGEVSIIQPEWAPDGTLYCVSDVSGWWNLQRLDGDSLALVFEADAEFGQPMWTFSESSFGVLADGRIGCTFGRAGWWRLGVVDPVAGTLDEIETDFNTFHMLRTCGNSIVAAAAGPETGAALVSVDVYTGAVEVIREGSAADLNAAYVSIPEPIAYSSAGGRTSHGFYYTPTNPDFTAPEGELPPLVVFTHGGPTGATAGSLALAVQYWTTRGFAVLDVNYGGSTGYGTAYRKLLHGNWGIVDMEDCAAGAQYLVERGDVDGARLAIRGGSAGGYTTLCSLTFGDVFTAGASYYGVSDAAALAEDTHKFESRYLDSLIGPYPERAELYEQRSPVHAVDRLSCPVIFLQGLEDEIVPPNQAERMVDALRKKGLPVAYLTFEGEQHGFRQAANIKRATEAELDFYGRIFGFTPAGEIEPVEIENL